MIVYSHFFSKHDRSSRIYFRHISSDHQANYVCTTSDCSHVASMFSLCVIHSHVSQASLPPQSDSGSVCGMCFGFVPKAYTEYGNKGPLCALFFTFLSPDISPAPGRTLKWLCAGRGPLDLCSLASVPWFGGGPYHLRQPKPPQQCNQRDTLHTTCCFAVEVRWVPSDR